MLLLGGLTAVNEDSDEDVKWERVKMWRRKLTGWECWREQPRRKHQWKGRQGVKTR